MKMINKQRVQRIKNLIYAFIIILMLLPLVLMSILSFQMFGAIKDLNAKVDNLGKAAAFQSTGQSSAPDSESILEPEPQASRPAGAEEPAQEPEADDSLKSGENPAASPEDVSFGVSVQGESTLPSSDSGNELGGGAPIENGAPIEDGDYLAATSADASDTEASGTSGSGAGNHSTEADKELATNPQMGYGDGAPSSDHTLNPSTGS